MYDDIVKQSSRLVMAQEQYRQWPFLTQDEFEEVCTFFDQRYVRAQLGPTRQIFKIRQRRIATTGTSYIEVQRLLT
jgi:ubiquitin-like-conjugating enzyme ATG10